VHIFWISDNPDTPSGFGMVTRFVCAGLARRGYRVSILGWQSHHPSEWNGCKIYPVAVDPLGGDAVFPLLVRHRPDIVIGLADIWWLPFLAAPHVRRQMELTDTRWVLYFPIDGDTDDGRLPPSWIEMLREVDVPVAMSRYGQSIANRCDISCEYIPHGVDLKTFAPPRDREEAKARIGASGKFLVLSDSRNQPRKLLPRLVDIFARFAAEHPDALLHLHTDPDDMFTHTGNYSYDLRADIRRLGIESQVRFSPGFSLKQGGGLPLEELAAYYKAADVHLLTSSGEGFGLPNLQAAAAGAVPMAAAYSASRELVEGHGETIAIREWTKTEFGIRRALVDMDDAVMKLERFYEDRELLRDRSARARRFALGYGWDAILDRWDTLLRSIADSRRCQTHRAYRRANADDTVVEREISTILGTSITVKMFQREIGRLEASIFADAHGAASDVRIPVVPPACELGGVRVPRRPGYVGVARGDAPAFLALKEVFPILTGWTPAPSPSAHLCGQKGLQILPIESPKEARFDLAQSVLVLDISGLLPEALLVDAATCGVPCVGTARVAAQLALWPELVTEDVDEAVRLARELLTNAARMGRLVAEAKLASRRFRAPCEEEIAASLRHLHAAQRAAAVTVMR